jgi:hypothetical protein
VLVDVATMLIAGGEAIADIDTLRHQGLLFGPVASPRRCGAPRQRSTRQPGRRST